ncbi:MAG: metal ABC transporter substrate-binding protein [Endomicrobium sp.]|jgi:zinc transport system substrate-binding protein|nr:metal ABC transporter substrate-binding protein [Endomicrobium sp.]
MKKTFAILYVFFNMLAFCGAAPFVDPNKTKITIAVSNINIGEITRAIGGKKVEVFIIVNSLLQPDFVELTPEIIREVEKSNLILSVENEKWINKLKIEAGTLGRIYKTLKTEGDWMIPHIHARAADEIKTILCTLDEENAQYYEENCLKYLYAADFAASAVKKELASAYGVKVIANSQIKSFLESYGFEIVGSFGKPKDLTKKRFEYLLKEGKKQKVKIVVDNLQISAATGGDLAKSLGAKHIALSGNILGKSYVNTLKENAARLKKALESK